jgi:Uma2 family endonuclease
MEDGAFNIIEKLYTEEEYEQIEHNGLVEYDSGRIIFMSPPLTNHQMIVGELFRLLANYLRNKDCRVFIAAFDVRLQLNDGVKRVEPDISVICDKGKLTDKGCEGAPDFVIEVASPSNLMHDYLTKVNWYQQAGVKEYWIVNPIRKEILVYRFEIPEVCQYTFNDIIGVGIWNNKFSIDFKDIKDYVFGSNME